MTKKEIKMIVVAQQIMRGYFALFVFYGGINESKSEQFLNKRHNMAISVLDKMVCGKMDIAYLVTKQRDLLFHLNEAYRLSLDNPFFIKRKIEKQLIKDIENVI